MPREKFQTLTEQMFYILLCLRTECCGIDVMAQVEQMTEGRVTIGPGTLYNLLVWAPPQLHPHRSGAAGAAGRI